MRWLDAIVLRLRTALRRDRANRDLDAEIAFYLDRSFGAFRTPDRAEVLESQAVSVAKEVLGARRM